MKNSSSKSCGSCGSKRNDLTGKVFTRLTVIGFSHKTENNRYYWKVKCVCGTEKIVSSEGLKSGDTKSCGCLRKEITGSKNRGKHLSLETCKKISENHANVSGENNPRYGSHFSEESRKKLSDSHIGLMKGIDHPNYGKLPHEHSGRGIKSWFINQDGTKIRLRSTYEQRMVNILEKYCIEWKYECRIQLGNVVWHPDFYLPEYDMYIEVKGWLTDDAKQKLILFNELYPNKKLLIIELNDIVMLENGYRLDQVGTLLSIYLQQMVQQ